MIAKCGSIHAACLALISLCDCKVAAGSVQRTERERAIRAGYAVIAKRRSVHAAGNALISVRGREVPVGLALRTDRGAASPVGSAAPAISYGRRSSRRTACPERSAVHALCVGAVSI